MKDMPIVVDELVEVHVTGTMTQNARDSDGRFRPSD
jgi:hypothetical protein